MYEQFYEKISAPWRRLENGSALLTSLDRALAWLVAAVYSIMLVWLLMAGDMRVALACAVPAATFVIASIVRRVLNRPRPYEEHAIDPLIEKETQGKSMPSRHMTSVVIIACALVWVNPAWGLGALLACALIAYTRIAGGVHYPQDIAAATALALACALVGFVAIPAF